MITKKYELNLIVHEYYSEDLVDSFGKFDDLLLVVEV